MIEKLGAPSTFQSPSYRGIEYLRSTDSALYMKTCGIQRCLPGYSYPYNGREGYHLHVVLSGKGILRVRGQEFQVHKRQMFLLKDSEEMFYQADQEDPWYYVWIVYGGDHALNFMEHAGFTEGVYVQDCRIDPMEFSNLVTEILERPHLNFSSEVYRLGLAIQFLSLAIENWEKRSDAPRQKADMAVKDYVAYAVRLIRNNYASIRISDVADYIGINRAYLTAIFREQMKISPQEYLMQVRMERSRELMLKTELPVRMVAREVGYVDQLAFSKIFKKKFGLSPEQYRRKHHDEYSIE